MEAARRDGPPPPRRSAVCRFAFYLGTPIRMSALVTEPDNSIIRQSYRAKEREEPLNGDGFGVGWYATGDVVPAVFRSLTPAWNNRNLIDLARAVESGCILAHVRAATRGLGVMEQNCHPFVSGRYAFMHNGEVGGFRAIRRALLESLSDAAFEGLVGTTDSEHLFAVFLDEVSRREESDRAAALAGALEASIRRVLGLVERFAQGSPSWLNLAVTDGECAVACRMTTSASAQPHSLYIKRGRQSVHVGGEFRIMGPERGARAVLISSERLSDDSGWQPIAPGSLMLVRPGLSVELRSLSPN
jgi:glutamine amidotransferase